MVGGEFQYRRTDSLNETSPFPEAPPSAIKLCSVARDRMPPPTRAPTTWAGRKDLVLAQPRSCRSVPSRGTFLGTLEELASNSTVKELIADGEVGTSLLLAAFNEDSFDAG
jgi:hypothetical protein